MKKVRIIALILAIIMAFSCAFPIAFAAEEEDSYAAAPYMLKTECVDESNNIVKAWLELSPSIAEAIASFHVSLQVKDMEGASATGRKINFIFDKALAGAKIKEAKIDEETQIVKLYVASASNLVVTKQEEMAGAEGETIINAVNILPLGNIKVEKLSDKALNAFKVVLSGKTGDLATVDLSGNVATASKVYGKDFEIPVDGAVYSLPAEYAVSIDASAGGEVKAYKLIGGSEVLVADGIAYDGTEIRIEAIPAEGYKLKSISVGGTEITSAPSFVISADSTVRVVFEKVEKPTEPTTEPTTQPTTEPTTQPTTKPTEPTTKPSGDSDGGCSCMCHSTGFMAFIYKIVRIFWKLFGSNKSCSCGAVHY